jgi:hypothetical protein
VRALDRSSLEGYFPGVEAAVTVGGGWLPCNPETEVPVAGDWISMRWNLTEDPDVIRIGVRLGANRYYVVGLLHAFWSWVDQHSEDGTLSHLGRDTIDGLVGQEGFAAALESVGWLVVTRSGITVPAFGEFMGESGKRRLRDRKRKRRQREGGLGGGTMSHSERDISPSREEKRTEEKRRGREDPAATRKRARPRKVPDTVHAQFLDWWCRAWEERRGSPYAVQAKDAAAVKAIRKMASEDLGEMTRRATCLLDAEDAWVHENASLSLLRSRWNQLTMIPGTTRKPGKMSWLEAEIAQDRENGRLPDAT